MQYIFIGGHRCPLKPNPSGHRCPLKWGGFSGLSGRGCPLKWQEVAVFGYLI